MIELSKSLLFCLLVCTIVNKQNPSSIISKVKTDKTFIQSSLDPKNIYAIDIQRIATNKQDQSSKCIAKQKQIKSFTQFQKFRVGSEHTRSTSVYEALTTLPDRQNGIDTFKILGDYIMVTLMNGTAFFLKNNKELQNNLKPIDLKITINAGNYKFQPLISAINGNAFVATARDLSFCQPKINKCTKIQGYKQVDALFNFQAFQYKDKMYLFFISGTSITTYEVSSNGAVFNQRIFKAQFFNKQKIFIYQVMPIPGNKLLILDFYSGVFQIEHSSSSLADLKKVNGIVYEQYGCRRMNSQKSGQFLTLQCSLTKKTFFILQLARLESSAKYNAHQPIFLNQALTGIQANSQIIIANIYSGIRLYWASNDIDTPYPYDYQNAGAIFLHNSKASQLWTLNDRKVIFICTEDELRIYQLAIVSPQIVCYSLVPIKQQYKISYTYLCDQQSLLHLKVCSVQKKLSYQSWQHKQVGYKTTLLPLLVSSILVLFVGILLIKLYRKYDKQIENTRLKYEANSQFGM